jgi:DNA invertase Pin-like site-specific DNA recombinase
MHVLVHEIKMPICRLMPYGWQAANVIYQDVASGAKSVRPELVKLLAQARSGDTLVIWKLDRLGRSLKHLVELVDELTQRKIGL